MGNEPEIDAGAEPFAIVPALCSSSCFVCRLDYGYFEWNGGECLGAILA
jgi:hypothetical protein